MILYDYRAFCMMINPGCVSSKNAPVFMEIFNGQYEREIGVDNLLNGLLDIKVIHV